MLAALTIAAPALLLGARPMHVAHRPSTLLLSATDAAFGASHTSFYTDAVRRSGCPRGGPQLLHRASRWFKPCSVR